MRLPKRLAKDAVNEALVELQFITSDVPELTVGRLASNPVWSTFRSYRLPAADIPAPIRDVNPEMRMQPTIEMRPSNNSRALKIGPNVISYHVLNQYCGWEVFRKELCDVITYVVANVPEFKTSRVGFRYINLLNKKDHAIDDITYLNCAISVDEAALSPPYNLSYVRHHDASHVCVVRIASPEFVQSPTGEPFSVAVDVDVATPNGLTFYKANEIINWSDKAHLLEKAEFFRLIPRNVLEKLAVEWEELT